MLYIFVTALIATRTEVNSFLLCKTLPGLIFSFPVQRSCGVATNQNITHFTNPGYPQEITESDDTTCTLTLLRPQKVPICQIRLDFLDFNIGRPTDGNCLDDKFSVWGNNINAPVPEICGQNSGQHSKLQSTKIISSPNYSRRLMPF